MSQSLYITSSNSYICIFSTTIITVSYFFPFIVCLLVFFSIQVWVIQMKMHHTKINLPSGMVLSLVLKMQVYNTSRYIDRFLCDQCLSLWLYVACTCTMLCSQSFIHISLFHLANWPVLLCCWHLLSSFSFDRCYFEPPFFLQTPLGDRIYSLKIKCGSQYPDQPPTIHFINKINMPGVDPNSGLVSTQQTAENATQSSQRF